MIDHMFFFVGLSLILTHELDAIKQQEWRIFPLTAWFNDTIGYLVFTTLHIPLFLWLLWGLSRAGGLSRPFIQGWDIFFLVHVVLHVLFLRHPKNQFTSAFSWILILGAGVAGALDLLLQP